MTVSGLFQELETHLLSDEKPSVYLGEIRIIPALSEYPFDMFKHMQTTPQSPRHHPEGSVWNHTLLVVDEAAKVKHKSKNPEAFMWAAMLHDIGKPSTTKIRGDKITSYDHDKAGAPMAEEFLSFFGKDKRFIRAVSPLVRYHMQILFVVNGLPYADIKGMTENTDINEVALLGLCDRLGRAKCDKRQEKENVRLFIEKVKRGETGYETKSRRPQRQCEPDSAQH